MGKRTRLPVENGSGRRNHGQTSTLAHGTHPSHKSLSPLASQRRASDIALHSMAQYTTQQTFNQALQHHQAGRLHEAELLYREILSRGRTMPMRLHHLGMTAGQAGRNDIAVELIGRGHWLHQARLPRSPLQSWQRPERQRTTRSRSGRRLSPRHRPAAQLPPKPSATLGSALNATSDNTRRRSPRTATPLPSIPAIR